MATTLILAVAAPLLMGLLFFEKKESTKGRLLTKPFLSALFIATALTGPRADPEYFNAGLVSFLAGHVLYTVAFFSLAGSGRGEWIVIALVLAVSVVVFAWLRPHLGKMLVPVLAYIAIITAMVIGAAALADTETVRFSGRALAFSGALLFYVSDIFVARHRFVTRNFFNRVVGLPLYFAGQFMIVFSIRLV